MIEFGRIVPALTSFERECIITRFIMYKRIKLVAVRREFVKPHIVLFLFTCSFTIRTIERIAKTSEFLRFSATVNKAGVLCVQNGTANDSFKSLHPFEAECIIDFTIKAQGLLQAFFFHQSEPMVLYSGLLLLCKKKDWIIRYLWKKKDSVDVRHCMKTSITSTAVASGNNNKGISYELNRVIGVKLAYKIPWQVGFLSSLHIIFVYNSKGCSKVFRLRYCLDFGIKSKNAAAKKIRN